MTPPALPNGYERGLNRFNAFASAAFGVPPVRLRWSDAEARWRLEQRVRRAHASLDERTAKHFRAGGATVETIQCWKDGYKLLWPYTPGMHGVRSGLPTLDHLTFILKWNLAEVMQHTTDTARDGKLLADELDARDGGEVRPTRDD